MTNQKNYYFIETQGDLIKEFKKGRFDLIGHQTNCFGTMGAGIAKSLSTQFPYLSQFDRILYLNNKDDNTKLFGTVSEVCFPYYIDNTNHINLRIVNLYSQYYPGTHKEVGFDNEYQRLDKLRLCLKSVNSLYKDLHIGLPMIGSGLGGGDWNKIKQIIKEELKNLDVTIMYYNQNV